MKEELGKLLLFREVVDAHGFSAAARAWGLSHSTVSKHIKSLERHLGVQLLHRSSRSMSLTEVGRLVHDYSERIGACVEELEERLEQAREQVAGELRVTSLVHLGRHLVQPAIAALVREYPKLRVRLMLDDGPLEFSRGGFDLAVRVGLEAEGSLRARKLSDNEVCLVATPELLARAGELRHPRELARYPTVAYATPAHDIRSWRYRERQEVRSVEVEPLLYVSDGNALLDAVKAGVGVGYVSAFAVQPELDRGELLRVLPEFELPAYAPVYMLYAASDYTSPKLEALQRALLRHAKSRDCGV